MTEYLPDQIAFDLHRGASYDAVRSELLAMAGKRVVASVGVPGSDVLTCTAIINAPKVLRPQEDDALVFGLGEGEDTKLRLACRDFSTGAVAPGYVEATLDALELIVHRHNPPGERYGGRDLNELFPG
jgi:hypothetical protein